MQGKRMGEYLTMPISLAVFPIVGCLVGRFLDRRTGTFPWLTILGLILGFTASARELWMVVKRPASRHEE